MSLGMNWKNQVIGNLVLNCALLDDSGQTQLQNSKAQEPEQPTAHIPIKRNIYKMVAIIGAIVIVLEANIAYYISLPEPEKEIDPEIFSTSLFFWDEDIPGEYRSCLHTYAKVKNENIKFILVDVSVGQFAIMDEPKDGDVVQIPGGCNLTFRDWWEPGLFNKMDDIIIHGGEPADKVFIVYKPTDEIITWSVLSDRDFNP